MAGPDVTFAGGVVHHKLNVDDRALGMAVQPDGSVVVVGQTKPVTTPGASGGLYVLRLTPTGELDPTFGTNGAFVIDTDAYEVAYAVALQPDGKIVVAGTTGQYPTILRLTARGALDAAFQGGIVEVKEVPGGIAQAVAVQPDGRIVFAGTGAAVGRLNPDGRLDAAFASGGFIAWDWSYPMNAAVAVALQADGKILVGGTNEGNIGTAQGVVARYTPAGTLDSTFGAGNGVVVTNLDTPLVDRTFTLRALAVQPDGKIVAAGQTDTYPGPPPVPGPGMDPTGGGNIYKASVNVALVRYTANGTLDTSFAGGGTVITRMTGQTNPGPENPAATITAYSASVGRAVAVDAAGRILVGGWSQQGWEQPMVARYTSSGLLDTTFGRGGVLLVDVGQRTGTVNTMAIQSDGRIVVAGRTHPWQQEGNSVMVARVAPGAGEGSVWAWGWGAVGQLGNGTLADQARPVRVPGLTGMVAVAAGTYHTLALRGDGTVWSWGWNGVGQLGDGTTTDRSQPVRVRGLTGVVAIAAGGLHSLALAGDGTVYAWGWNGVGQLGDATTGTRTLPVRVVGLQGAISIAAGSFHSLAIREDGSAWGWGWNAAGQVGDTTTSDRAVPVRLPDAYRQAPYTAVTAGGLHSMAIAVPLTLLGWGWTGVGQVKMPPPEFITYPDRGPGFLPVAVSAGGYHTLVLEHTGKVFSGGWNGVGQLGDGSTVTKSWTLPVAGLPPLAAVSAGGYHSLGLSRDGRVWSWGWNAVGQLGLNTTVVGTVPALVAGFTDVAAVSAGGAHSTALRV